MFSLVLCPQCTHSEEIVMTNESDPPVIGCREVVTVTIPHLGTYILDTEFLKTCDYGRLWSIDDMMRYTAAGILTSLLWLSVPHAEFIGGGIDDLEFRSKLRKGLKDVKESADVCKLSKISQKIDRLLDTWLKGDDNDIAVVIAMVAFFVGETQAELCEHIFFRIPTEERSFYDDVQLTTAAMNAFPSAVPEVSNAGKCFALDQPTATVLHLMRALEVPLAALVAALNFTPSNPNWQTVINKCEREIRASKNRTDQEFFGEAATNFLYFKNAWRNHAMHGRDTYDKQQAFDIMMHVGGFMKILSKRLCGSGGYTTP
jgi:hypothetical protein